MTVDLAELVAAARRARANAYAPYSGFHVGAALAIEDGGVVTGANFENASYGLSLCAEAVVIASASAQGLLARAVAIAVVGDHIAAPSGAIVTPCGRCRQMLAEAEAIAGRALVIYCAPVADGAPLRYSLAELLPHSFGPASLAQGNDLR